jgi:hypothetical protein
MFQQHKRKEQKHLRRSSAPSGGVTPTSKQNSLKKNHKMHSNSSSAHKSKRGVNVMSTEERIALEGHISDKLFNHHPLDDDGQLDGNSIPSSSSSLSSLAMTPGSSSSTANTQVSANASSVGSGPRSAPQRVDLGLLTTGKKKKKRQLKEASDSTTPATDLITRRFSFGAAQSNTGTPGSSSGAPKKRFSFGGIDKTPKQQKTGPGSLKSFLSSSR